MNNRNWVAVFLGLACLVLFVSVMGASGNWLNNNNGENNNSVVPQQINQNVRGMDNNTAPDDGSMPTEIDANKITDDMGNTANDMSNNGKNAVTDAANSVKDAVQDGMSKLNMPKMNQ